MLPSPGAFSGQQESAVTAPTKLLGHENGLNCRSADIEPGNNSCDREIS